MPRPVIVVVGGGFGGLELVKHLHSAAVDIVLIDRRNHHLFQPLLYQVATAALSPAEIAQPIRSIMRNMRNVTVLLDEVVSVDPAARQVECRERGKIAYDDLVLATGVEYNYFGHADWPHFAPSLKTLSDATDIRRRLLLAFERAEACADDARRRALMTFVLVGGGPTGVELAGSIAELARFALRRDFRNTDPSQTRIVLVEAGPHLLPGFAPKLSDYAKSALERLHVDVRLNTSVDTVDAEGVVAAGERLHAGLVIWCAGVRAVPVAGWFGAPTARNGTVEVAPDLSVPGHPNVFIVGDAASVSTATGRPLPQVAPVAKEQGAYVARVLRARLSGEAAPKPFVYRDFGSLAIIGRSAAVVDFGFARLTGVVGWLIWAFAHIFFLIGFRSRVAVFLSWGWEWATYARGARLIVGAPRTAGTEDEARER